MILESEARLEEAQQQSSLELERRIQEIDIQQREIQVRNKSKQAFQQNLR